MVKIKNECVGCKSLGIPCMGNDCMYRNVKRYYCDKCGNEVNELHDYDDMQLCDECLWNEKMKGIIVDEQL